MTENGVQVNVNQDPEATGPSDPATPEDDGPDTDENRVTGEPEPTAEDDAADE